MGMDGSVIRIHGKVREGRDTVRSEYSRYDLVLKKISHKRNEIIEFRIR